MTLFLPTLADNTKEKKYFIAFLLSLSKDPFSSALFNPASAGQHSLWDTVLSIQENELQQGKTIPCIPCILRPENAIKIILCTRLCSGSHRFLWVKSGNPEEEVELQHNLED